jgi:type IV pilus assembly protein PilA
MQAPPPKKGFPTWAIVLLIVGACVVLFGGVFVVLALVGVRKYVANAKTAEARNSLGQMAKDAAEAYEKESMATTLVPGGSAAATHRVCPSASRPVPASIAMVSGKKYMSDPSDWTVDQATDSGFACLRFSMDMPQYYQYGYDATPSSFTATAHGDLNGDGVTSSFVLRGRVSGGSLDIAPNIEETNPQE